MSKQPLTEPKKQPPQRSTKPQDTEHQQLKPPSRWKSWMTTLRHNILLAMASGILAFAGALAGAMLVQQAIWDQQVHYDLTQKRIDLIERTVALMGKNTANLAQERNYTKSFITAMAQTAGDPTRIGTVVTNLLNQSANAKCDIADAHAEFMTILELNDIFFGEKTHQAVLALQMSDPWYMADSSLKADLLQSMREDFFEMNRQRRETPL
ncbi:hypothetical protein ACFLZR_00220 [Candidatus Neomarinimicrobiota bacterium]